MKKQTFRDVLSFSAVFKDTARLAYSGLSLGAPTRSSDTASFSNSAGLEIPSNELMDVPFRLLSATTVGAGTWKTMDFSKAGVLKKGVSMLSRKPVYTDHWQYSDNWVGLVVDPYWENSYTAEDGTLIPGGINGTLRIDTVSNQKIARGLALGALASVSVTVSADWEPSHKFDSIWDFYDALGTIHADGTMVRRIATKIFDFFEVSIVWLGADPFAKRIDENGELVNVDKSSISYDKGAKPDKAIFEAYDKDHTLEIPYCLTDNVLSLSRTQAQKPQNQSQNSPEMNKAFLSFAQAWNAAYAQRTNLTLSVEQDPTPEQITALMAAIEALKPTEQPTETPQTDPRIDAFTKGLNTPGADGALVPFVIPESTENSSYVLLSNTAYLALQTKADKATDGLSLTAERITELQAVETAFLTLKRDECKRLYSLSAGDKVNNAILSLFDKMTSAELDSTLAHYSDASVLGMTATCPKCGSVELSMRSSHGEDPAETTGSGSTEIRDANYFRNKHGKY